MWVVVHVRYATRLSVAFQNRFQRVRAPELGGGWCGQGWFPTTFRMSDSTSTSASASRGSAGGHQRGWLGYRAPFYIGCPLGLQTIEPFGEGDLAIIIYVTIARHLFATFSQLSSRKVGKSCNNLFAKHSCNALTLFQWQALGKFSTPSAPKPCSCSCLAVQSWALQSSRLRFPIWCYPL